MTDVFDDDDAAIVLRFYENFNRFAFGYYTPILSADRGRIRKLVRMGVVSSHDDNFLPGRNYANLNFDHPDVKAIIEAMELL